MPHTPPTNPIVVIPARLAARRLPNKPLAQIHGTPMIVHCLRRAQEAEIGPVLVACAEDEVAAAVRDAGGDAVLTDPSLASGSDRVYAALMARDPDGNHDAVVNLQGDLPTISISDVRAVLACLNDSAVDIGTLVAEITDPDERAAPSVVKAVIAGTPTTRTAVRALYFSRATVPTGEGPLYHHIGIYAYRRAALQAFVELPPSPLERRERLEQLRALEAGMTIAAARVDTVPLGVDTPADLARARELLASDTS